MPPACQPATTPPASLPAAIVCLGGIATWAVLLHTCRQSRRNVDSRDRADGHPPTAAAVRAALLSYHANGWEHLLAIRSALIEAGHSAVPLSPRDRTDAWLDQHGVPYVPLNGPPPGSALVAAAVDWANRAPLDLSDPVLEQTGRAGGPLRWFLRIVAFHAAWLYASSAPMMARWLRQQRFNMVLGTDSGSVPGRCLFRTAQALGLPAVFVQHGSLTTRPGVDRYIAASHCLMWGEMSCENLARAGATPRAAIPAGSPLLESRLLAAQQAAQRSTSSEPGHVLVAFGFPGGLFGDTSFAQAAGALARAARELADTRFIVKLHPGDSGDLWRRAIDDAATSNVTIERSASTYDLLARCRLLVTMQSTLGSEAAVLDKPVVALNFDRVQVGTEFLAAGSAYELFDAAAVLPCLKELLDGPPGADRLAETRRAFARRFLTLTDEPATVRTVRHLADLVPGSTPTTTPRPDACQPASR
jgi:hypothetical protein